MSSYHGSVLLKRISLNKDYQLLHERLAAINTETQINCKTIKKCWSELTTLTIDMIKYYQDITNYAKGHLISQKSRHGLGAEDALGKRLETFYSRVLKRKWWSQIEKRVGQMAILLRDLGTLANRLFIYRNLRELVEEGKQNIEPLHDSGVEIMVLLLTSHQYKEDGLPPLGSKHTIRHATTNDAVKVLAHLVFIIQTIVYFRDFMVTSDFHAWTGTQQSTSTVNINTTTTTFTTSSGADAVHDQVVGDGWEESAEENDASDSDEDGSIVKHCTPYDAAGAMVNSEGNTMATFEGFEVSSIANSDEKNLKVCSESSEVASIADIVACEEEEEPDPARITPIDTPPTHIDPAGGTPTGTSPTYTVPADIIEEEMVFDSENPHALMFEVDTRQRRYIHASKISYHTHCQSDHFLRAFMMVSQLGNGSFGTVHSAIRRSDGMSVAIKVSLAHSVPSWSYTHDYKPIPSEYAVLLKCHHPHVIRYIDHFCERGDRYVVLVTEVHGTSWGYSNPALNYIDNPNLLFEYGIPHSQPGGPCEFETPYTLDACVIAHDRVPYDKYILSQVVKALLYLKRELGVVHRDLKEGVSAM